MNNRIVSAFLIFTQLLSGIPSAFAEGFLHSALSDNDDRSSSLASGLSSVASAHKHLSDRLLDNAADSASGLAADQLAGWMRQFGTARIDLNVDRHGEWDTSSVDWLVPFWQSPRNILFTQLGFRNPDGRRTLNSGIGVRTFSQDWMLGANVFIDNDFTGHNRRVGLGAEVGRDYLKLSANTYFGMTDWHQSRDYDDYDERPADGWDLRTQAWLPALPQLGGQLVYEKYHGESVALADKDTRRRNPSAITAGLSYTPVPLVSFGVDHRMPAGGNVDTQLSFKLRYEFGTPWSSQISPDAVSALHTLTGSKYDLVDRNNTIVIDYRKQELISLNLPQELKGEGSANLSIIAQVTSKYALNTLDWSFSSVTSAGGELVGKGDRDIKLRLPGWRVHGANQYRVSAVARDAHGNRSRMASTLITISEPQARLTSGSVKVLRNNAQANGTSTNEVQATVTDVDGNPVSGKAVNFTATNGAIVTAGTGTTGADGTVRAILTSISSGTSVVTASLINGQSGSVAISFSDAARIAANDLTVTQNNAAADGVAKNSVQARVTDATGKPVNGQKVSFMATNGATVRVVTSMTGADGIARATLTSKTAGPSTVTAVLINGTSANVGVFFSAFARIAAGDMMVTKNNAVADGVAINTVEARVTDAAGKALSGQTVNFNATNGALVSVVTATTGTNGIAAVNLTSEKKGSSVITATLQNGLTASVTATFTSPSDISIRDVTILHNNAKADGHDENKIQFKVTDGSGAGLEGQQVTFAATGGAVISASKGQTTADGIISITLTSQSKGSPVVTATLSDGTSVSATVTFITAAEIESGSFLVTTNNALADGMAKDKVQLRVVDGSGNSVYGQRVTFTATNGVVVNSASVTTDSSGLASTTLTSTTAGGHTVTATMSDGTSATVLVSFITAAEIESGSFIVITNNALADGTATNVVQLRVVNGNGVAVSGENVTFAATNGAAITRPSVTTDKDGLASTALTNTRAGRTTVNAMLSNGTNASATVTFITAVNIEPGSFIVTANNAVADGSAANAVKLRVVNSEGNAVSGQQIIFKTSGDATPNSLSVTTNEDGVAITTLTSTTPGDRVVTATLTSTGENATVKVTFTRPYSDFASLTAGGSNFSINEGFPETGFTGAYFDLKLPGRGSADDYVWSSSASWVSIRPDAGKSTGQVIFNGEGKGGTVTITATPAKGNGQAYRYKFSVKKWFIFNEVEADRNSNSSYCAGAGYGIPSYTDMTNAPVSRQSGTRAVGSLWSEWGDLTRYNVGIRPHPNYMSSYYTDSIQYSVRLSSGWIYDISSDVDTLGACMNRL